MKYFIMGIVLGFLIAAGIGITIYKIALSKALYEQELRIRGEKIVKGIPIKILL